MHKILKNDTLLTMLTFIPKPFLWTLIVTLGLIMGSFLNVVILRLPLDQSVIHPPSHCPCCKTLLPWYYNIPLLSFLILKGKCAFCQHPISYQYPLIEGITALLWIAVIYHNGMNGLKNMKDLFFVSSLLCVSFIDLKHRIIPDILSLGGIGVGFLCSFFSSDILWWQSLLGALFGYGFFYLTATLYAAIKKQEGLGGGDIKLLGMIGAFLGIPGVFTTILIGSTTGTLIGILVGWIQQQKAPLTDPLDPPPSLLQTAIPFGPFLVIGAFIHLFFSDFLWFLSTIPI